MSLKRSLFDCQLPSAWPVHGPFKKASLSRILEPVAPSYYDQLITQSNSRFGVVAGLMPTSLAALAACRRILRPQQLALERQLSL